MKLVRKLRQHRRDCDIAIECEGCGTKEIVKGAYDDKDYWNNKLPNRRCEECNESTTTLACPNCNPDDL